MQEGALEKSDKAAETRGGDNNFTPALAEPELTSLKQ